MGLLSFHRTKVTAAACPSSPPPPSASWKTTTWPSCTRSPRTDSFRAVDHRRHNESAGFGGTGNSRSSDDDENHHYADGLSKLEDGDESEKKMVVIHGHASADGRLLFDPVGTTSSILEESKAVDGFPFKEGKVLVVESDDPYLDFRRSMEEMVVAHGVVEDLVALRQLLDWYLKVNQEKTHQLIFEAFIDLLQQLSSPPPSSSLSSRSSSCLLSCERDSGIGSR